MVGIPYSPDRIDFTRPIDVTLERDHRQTRASAARPLCQKPSPAASRKQGHRHDKPFLRACRRSRGLCRRACAREPAGVAAGLLSEPPDPPNRQLAIELNQSIVVENRPGAGGTIGARDAVNADPDGYMLTLGQTPEIAVNP